MHVYHSVVCVYHSVVCVYHSMVCVYRCVYYVCDFAMCVPFTA